MDSVTDERREHIKAEAVPREPKLDCVPAAWLAAIDKRIEHALDQYDLAIGQIISEERARLDERMEDLRMKLQRELDKQRGDVVDLPSPFLRKRRDAA